MCGPRFTPDDQTGFVAVGDKGIPKGVGKDGKIFLHQGVHLDGFSFRDEWVKRLHPWFDYWLHDIDNGIVAVTSETVMMACGTWVTRKAPW